MTLTLPEDALGRRELLGIGLATLALAGCGGDDPAPTTADPADGKALDLVDDRGPVAIDAVPTRVVTVSEEVTELVVALGFAPVAVASGRITSADELDDNYLGEALSEPDYLGDAEEIDYEAVLGARPDLIVIAGPVEDGPLSRLAKIAPTAVYDITQPDAWETAIAQLGTGLERADRAQAAVDAYRTEVMAAGETLAAQVAAYPRLCALIVDYRGDGGNLVLGPEFSLATVFGELGFELTSFDGEPVSPGVTPISLEQVPGLDADVVVAFSFGAASDSPAQRLLDSLEVPVVPVLIDTQRPPAGPLTSPDFLAQYVEGLAAI